MNPIEITILQFLKQFIETITTPMLERSVIISSLIASSNQILKERDIINFLNRFFSSYVVSKRPIIYESIIISNHIKNFDVAQLQTIPLPNQSVKKEKMPKTIQLENNSKNRKISTVSGNNNIIDGEIVANRNFDISAIDATQDPSIQTFVATASYSRVEKLMNQKHPVNIYIFGETGIGKTVSVLVAGKKMKRPVVRFSCSFFTDLDDLFGGIRIENGNTVCNKGPAIIAMELGAILLLDEIDRLNPQVAHELFPVLEGKGYLIKKMNKMIYPAPGFCVIGTGNSKGRGDLSGNYSTQILDKALLDRFPVAVHYKNPTREEMQTILTNYSLNLNSGIISNISRWYSDILQAHNQGAITDYLSPRKIIDISKSFANANVKWITSSKANGALEDAMCLLDEDTSEAFTKYWEMITDDDARRTNIEDTNDEISF